MNSFTASSLPALSSDCHSVPSRRSRAAYFNSKCALLASVGKMYNLDRHLDDQIPTIDI